MTETQKKIINSLESEGHFVLADSVQQVLADKNSRRKSKVKAIRLAANIRDNLESITNKLLQKHAGSGIKDVAELLKADFDRLEDKMAKLLNEYFEYKSNQENVPEEEIKDKNDEPRKHFKEPKILKPMETNEPSFN